MSRSTVSGVYLGGIWNVSGVYLECIWGVSGVYLGCIWNVSGVYLECIWSVTSHLESTACSIEVLHGLGNCLPTWGFNWFGQAIAEEPSASNRHHVGGGRGGGGRRRGRRVGEIRARQYTATAGPTDRKSEKLFCRYLSICGLGISPQLIAFEVLP